jgi:hypothetical protein
LKGIREIDAGLVGDADDHKHHIRKFIRQRGLMIFAIMIYDRGMERFPAGSFEALVPEYAGHDPGDLADLFDQLGEVGQLGEVADPEGANPGIHHGLVGLDA